LRSGFPLGPRGFCGVVSALAGDNPPLRGLLPDFLTAASSDRGGGKNKDNAYCHCQSHFDLYRDEHRQLGDIRRDPSPSKVVYTEPEEERGALSFC
jgi:hypothetical protein